MKNFLAFLMAIAMMTSLSVSAFALDFESDKSSPMSEKFCTQVYEQIADAPASTLSSAAANSSVSIEAGQYLYSFEEQPIAILYRFSPQGYAIFDYKNETVLEYSTDSDNLFYTDKDEKYYYNGVLDYYEATDDGFKNLATGTVLTAEDCAIINADDFYSNSQVPENSMRATDSEGPTYLANTTRLYNCNTNTNLSYFYPNATSAEIAAMPGVCGSLACAVMVAYYDDHESSMGGSGDFATDWKKTYGESYNNTYGKYLVREFIDYVEPRGNGSFFLNPGMTDYLRAHGISGGCTLGLLSVYQQTKNAIGSIGDGVPLIIGLSNHYCVGVGYKNVTEKQIQVNNGYGGYSWINASTVVSTWTMNL